MALRYLLRRALEQRSLVPRVPPSAGSRPVCTCGASPPPPQGVLMNESKAAAASKGNKVPEQLQTDFLKLTTDEQICQEWDKLNSMLKAFIVVFKKYTRYQQANHDNSGLVMGAGAAGAGLAFLHIAYDIRNKREIALGEEVADFMITMVVQRLLTKLKQEDWQLMLEDSSKDGEDQQDDEDI